MQISKIKRKSGNKSETNHFFFFFVWVTLIPDSNCHPLPIYNIVSVTAKSTDKMNCLECKICKQTVIPSETFLKKKKKVFKTVLTAAVEEITRSAHGMNAINREPWVEVTVNCCVSLRDAADCFFHPKKLNYFYSV